MATHNYLEAGGECLERQMQRIRAVARLSSVSVLLLVAAVGCGQEDDDDQLAAEQVTAAVEAGADLARLIQPLDGDDRLLGLTAPEVVRQKIVDAIDGYRSAFTRPDCVTFDTDDATFLELFFDDCSAPLGLITLDGSLRAELAIDLDNVGQPLSLTFGIGTDRLEIGTPKRLIEIAADYQTTHALAGSAPVQFLGELHVNELGETLDVTAEASWSVADGCVTLDAGAQIGGTAVRGLGTISASIAGLSRCRDECPSSGDALVSYGTGTFLKWSYDGSDVVSVFGPQGKQLDVPLSCGD